MKITIFSEELRKCLDAVGLSDCGENDEWNYWYQRVLKAHNDAVERQIATEQSENEKLRELVRDMSEEIEAGGFDPMVERQGKRGVYYEEDPSWRVGIRERMRELGIEAKE